VNLSEAVTRLARAFFFCARLLCFVLWLPRLAAAGWRIDPPVNVSLSTDAAADTARSADDGSASPAGIPTLRGRADHNPLRVFLGQDAYASRGAALDSTGVAFAPGDLRGVPARDNGGTNGDYTRPAPLASPIGWDRIDRIDVRKSCGLRGALVGGLIGAAAFGGIVGLASRNGGEIGLGFLLLIWLPPAGAVLGGAAGSTQRRSETVWERAKNDPGSAAQSGR
jgi:hypothetical protein